MLCFVIINSILFNLKCFDHIYIDQENHPVFLSCPIQTLRVHYIHTSILCTTQKNMYNVHTHKKRTKKDSLNLTNKHCNAIGLSTWGPSWTLHHVQQMLFKTLEALWANIKNVRFFFPASYVIQCKEQNLQILLRDATYITIITVTNSELALRIKQAEICR